MLGSQLNTAQREEATFRLKSLSLFAPFDNEVMDDLLGHVTLKSLKEDDVLFKQDEVAKHFFVVQTGQVKLLRSSNAGNEKIIEFVSDGQSFAEAVMFSGKHLYPVTCVALQATQVWCVSSEHYKTVLRISSDACFAVMAELSRRLHQHVAEIDSLTLHNASARLVAFLMDMAADSQNKGLVIELPYTKAVLASRLSIKPETLSRVFARLVKEKMIRVDDRSIELLDIERLTQVRLMD